MQAEAAESEQAAFVFRDIRPEDRAEVLALTANTWENGDYIHWVFDDWLNDPTAHGTGLLQWIAQFTRVFSWPSVSRLPL